MNANATNRLVVVVDLLENAARAVEADDEVPTRARQEREGRCRRHDPDGADPTELTVTDAPDVEGDGERGGDDAEQQQRRHQRREVALLPPQRRQSGVRDDEAGPAEHLVGPQRRRVGLGVGVATSLVGPVDAYADDSVRDRPGRARRARPTRPRPPAPAGPRARRHRARSALHRAGGHDHGPPTGHEPGKDRSPDEPGGDAEHEEAEDPETGRAAAVRGGHGHQGRIRSARGRRSEGQTFCASQVKSRVGVLALGEVRVLDGDRDLVAAVSSSRWVRRTP